MIADWESFAAALELVIEAGVQLGEVPAEISAAREQFLRWVGQPFGDEASFDRRNAAFLEWFVFDRPLDGSGRCPAEELLHREAAMLAPNVVAYAERLRVNLLTIGSVKRIKPGEITLERWANGEKIAVTVGLSAGVDKGAALLGRVFSVDGRRFGSPAAELIVPRRAARLRKALKREADIAGDDAQLFAAGMRFHLVEQRYPMAEPDQLVQRWRDINHAA